jgi:hypothetical protein
MTLLGVILAAAFVLAGPSTADAGFFYVLQSGGTTIVVPGAGGTVSNTTTIGNLTVTSNGVSLNPTPLIDLHTLTVSSGAPGGTVTVTLFDMNFPATAATETAFATIGGTVNPVTGTAQVTGQSYVDTTNSVTATPPSTFPGIPAGATAIFSPQFDSGVINPPGQAVGGSASLSFTPNGAFALITQVTFTFTGQGTASIDSNVQVTATPAPAGLVMALSALPFVGLGYWRKRRSTAVA